MAGSPGVIAKGLRIKGELTGVGDLVIEGQVEGRIQMNNHLVIEPSGVVNANIEVDKITVRANANVSGEITAPTVILEDGASFKGSIHMDVGIPEDI